MKASRAILSAKGFLNLPFNMNTSLETVEGDFVILPAESSSGHSTDNGDKEASFVDIIPKDRSLPSAEQPITPGKMFWAILEAAWR
jgi:hypothetical protein